MELWCYMTRNKNVKYRILWCYVCRGCKYIYIIIRKYNKFINIKRCRHEFYEKFENIFI